MQRASLLAAIVATGLFACGASSDVDPKAAECADYCDLIGVHCMDPVNQYTDRTSCLATCQAMPLGDPAVHTGNTVMCRTFTAALAETDPTTTCPQAGPGGNGVCGGNCESFCTIAAEICTGANQAYASTAECMTACAAFPTAPAYNAGVTGGDSFACRLYHLTAATGDPGFHCPHIRPQSATCGS